LYPPENFSTNTVLPDFHTTTSQDVFVLKLSSADGSRLALRTNGGAGIDAGLNIAVAPTGQSVVLTGSYQGTVDFNDQGGTNAANILKTAPGVTSSSSFALSLNSGLGINWARTLVNGFSSIGTGVGIDGAGNAYIIGTYTDSTGNFEFIEKRDASGGFVAGGVFGRVPQLPLSGVVETPTIAVHSAGNSYISGNFKGSGVDFDPSASTSTMDSAGGAMNVFVIRLNSDLGLVWKTRFGGSVTDGATGIANLNGGIAIGSGP